MKWGDKSAQARRTGAAIAAMALVRKDSVGVAPLPAPTPRNRSNTGEPQEDAGRARVAGGVGANRNLREQLNAECAKRHIRVHYPELHLCTDNGAMIAMAAAMRLQSGQQTASEVYAFDVKPRWPLDSIQIGC